VLRTMAGVWDVEVMVVVGTEACGAPVDFDDLGVLGFDDEPVAALKGLPTWRATPEMTLPRRSCMAQPMMPTTTVEERRTPEAGCRRCGEDQHEGAAEEDGGEDFADELGDFHTAAFRRNRVPRGSA